MNIKDITIPENWPVAIRRAVVHSATLAHYAITYTRSMAADSKLQRVRLAGSLDHARHEISLLQEEIRILHTRIEKIPPKNRPPFFTAMKNVYIFRMKICVV